MTKENVIVNVPTGVGDVPVTMQKHDGQSVDIERSKRILAEAQEKTSWERIGQAAEAFNAMHQAYAADYGLTPEELSAAVYLENINMREFFPIELGGPTGYDNLCKATWAWFETQKNKAD
jgi:hypothetical protein